MTASEPPSRVEPGWGHLEAQHQLMDGQFWLGVIFGMRWDLKEELLRRTRELLGSVDAVAELRMDHPTAVPDLLTALQRDDSSASCIWVTEGPTPIGVEAWSQLLLRLNERRDVVASRHSGGLVLCCPTEMLSVFREGAQDLWSFRTMTLYLDAE